MTRRVNRCADCAVNVTPKRRAAGRWWWYMVLDEVWAAAGMGDGHLCLPCLEARLGRRVTVNDLLVCPLNIVPDSLDAPELARLKQQLATALAWHG